MDPLFASLAALALATSGVHSGSAAGGSDQQTSNTADAASNENDDPLDHYYDILWTRKYADALAFASSFSPDNPQGKAIVDAMRAAALLGLKRDSEARQLITEADQLAPELPDSTRIVFIGGVVSDRMDFAADALDRLIARAPDVVRDIEWDYLRYFLAHAEKDDPKRNDGRRVALARIGYGGETPQGYYLASAAVDVLVRRGDFTGAEDFLPSVREPTSIENMLIDRRYAPLWSKLEQLVGPHLQKPRDASVAAAQEAYTEAPDDHERLKNLLNALREAGRLKEAIALRSKLPRGQAEMAKADEQMGWAVNNLAYALHAAGQIDGADGLFASLNDAPIPNGDWLINMKINRLELLVQDGKFKRALPLIEPTAKTEGTPYADQLTRRLRYCTLTRLRRTQEAAQSLPDLMAHAKDAPSATIGGLLCAGQVDKAEELALASLKEPDEKKRLEFEKDFLRNLQPQPLTADDPSVWDEGWHQLRQRPAIAAEFNRLGRDMPENLLPPTPDTTK